MTPTSKPKSGPDTEISPDDLSGWVGQLMLEKSALDVSIMDLRGITSMTDCVVLCTGSSAVQVKAIVDHVDNSLREDGIQPHHIEGYEGRRWVILDYINVVVHIFLPQQREYYNLERLWADAKILQLDDAPA